jgi:hypothetical protein
MKPHGLQQRLDGERRDRREEVVVGCRQTIVLPALEGTKTFGVFG